MIIDHLTPHLPKNNEEVNKQVKHLQAMLDTARVVDLVLECGDGVWVKIPTTARAHVGTGLAFFFHRRSVAKYDTEMTGMCATLLAVEMHAAGLKVGAKSEITSNRSDAMKGTMIITVPSMTNLTDSVPLKKDAMKEESRFFPILEEGALALEFQSIRNREV
jgi:hypothetical protein